MKKMSIFCLWLMFFVSGYSQEDSLNKLDFKKISQAAVPVIKFLNQTGKVTPQQMQRFWRLFGQNKITSDGFKSFLFGYSQKNPWCLSRTKQTMEGAFEELQKLKQSKQTIFDCNEKQIRRRKIKRRQKIQLRIENARLAAELGILQELISYFAQSRRDIWQNYDCLKILDATSISVFFGLVRYNKITGQDFEKFLQLHEKENLPNNTQIKLAGITPLQMNIFWELVEFEDINFYYFTLFMENILRDYHVYAKVEDVLRVHLDHDDIVKLDAYKFFTKNRYSFNLPFDTSVMVIFYSLVDFELIDGDIFLEYLQDTILARQKYWEKRRKSAEFVFNSTVCQKSTKIRQDYREKIVLIKQRLKKYKEFRRLLE